jgi:ACS family glucarate transporter-like MFS transporter
MVGQPIAAAAAAPRGNLRWVMIFWVFIVAAVSYLDRNNLSIAVSQVQAAYDLSTVEMGYVFSAFVAGYALTQPIAGRIADHFGPYKVIAIALVWWGVFTALTPMVPSGLPHSITLLIVVRCLLGVGEAVIFPASNRLVASWIPTKERGLANGLIFAGIGIGGGVAPPLITFIMITYGWQWAFYISAIIGFLIVALWLLFIRDKPSDHPRISEEEAAYIEAGLPPSVVASTAKVRWVDLIGDRQVLILTASYFCFGYVAYIFYTWFFKYLSAERGLDLKATAIYAMLPFIAMTIFSTLGGFFSDKLCTAVNRKVGRCGVAGVGMFLAAIFVAAATQVADARTAALVLTCGAGSLFLAQSAYWALSADMGGRFAGSLSGLMNMGAQAGGFVTAIATAKVATEFGWTASFIAAAVVCLVGAIAWIFINPHHQLRGQEAPPAQ